MQNMRDVDTLLREFEASLRRVTNEISDREALNTLASALMTHDIQPSSRPCAQRALKNLQRFETWFRDTREVRRDLESELEESLESSNQPAEAVTERKRKHHDSPERGEQRAAKTQNRSQETSARSATQSIPSATERSQQMQTQQPPGGGSSAAASAHHSGPGISHAAATSRANLNSTALVTQPTSTQQKPPPDPKEQFMAWGHSLFNDSGCVFRTSEKYTLEQVTNAKYVGPIELYPETKTMMRVMVQVIERACDDAHDTNLTLGMKVNKTTSWDGKRLDLDFKNMSARQYLESVSQKSYDTALNDLRQFSALLGKSEEVYYYQASFWKPLLDRRIQVEPAVNAKESDVQIRNRVVKAFAKEAGVPIRNNIGHELHRVANILHDLRTGATDHTWLILYGGKPFFEKLKNTARLTVDVVRKWADLYRPLVNRITVRIASLRRNSLMIPNRIVCALESVLAVHANFPPVQDRSRYRSYWHEDQRLTGPLYLARELTGTADVHSVVTDLVVARGKLLRVNAGRTSTLLRWGFQGATKKNHALLTDIVRMRDDGGEEHWVFCCPLPAKPGDLLGVIGGTLVHGRQEGVHAQTGVHVFHTHLGVSLEAHGPLANLRSSLPTAREFWTAHWDEGSIEANCRLTLDVGVDEGVCGAPILRLLVFATKEIPAMCPILLEDDLPSP